MASFSISWSAPEFEYRDKDVAWYWISIIAASCIIAFAVWQRDFLFGFFIVIAEILFVAWGDRFPRPVSFTLTERELSIEDKKSYPMSQLESWSAEPLDDEWTELLFNFKAKLKTPLKMLVPAHLVEDIRKNLKTVLREVEHQPTLLDALEKLIRF
ncbi:MAG: hypothetical protein KGJ13_02495 [Patescibacteria group bacterium]|nr:hypothetical protein [Patescibacteria group bacterium]